ncbi:hypothetical protein [Nocardioides sp. SYSU DS0651]|uniref:hypothetical protein n=1 Tax=Nocardioides sp. SYSU DS0651 TaxID=3415955 RepID=UPI003F4C29AE
MKPLHAVAFGLVLLALGPADPEPGVLDPAPDPLGWLLILIGLHGLGPALDARRLPLLRLLGVLALVVSVALVVPGVARWVAADPSLGWAADVPRFAFLAVLCHLLGRSAQSAGQALAANLFATAALTLVFVLAVPPLAFGAGWDAIGPAGEVAAQVVQLALVVLCLGYAGRRWAGAPPPTPAPEA